MFVRDRIPRMLARAADLAEERARRERARKVVERWNQELALGDLPLWSPSIRAAMIAGMPWLEVLCPGCATDGAVNLSLLNKPHPVQTMAGCFLAPDPLCALIQTLARPPALKSAC